MFDFSCHSAVMRAVWGEMCMNLDKCFCFLSLIPKEQPHNLPLKAEVLPLLCVYFIFPNSVWGSCREIQFRI